MTHVRRVHRRAKNCYRIYIEVAHELHVCYVFDIRSDNSYLHFTTLTKIPFCVFILQVNTIMATTQQVFRLSQRTSIRDLETRDEPIPEPSSNEVLIHIRSVALNFRDYAVATGKYPFPVKDDVVPCSDLSGDVVEVGSHVDDFAPGDRVISVFDISTLYGAMKDWNHSLGGKLDGALRQYITLPSAALVKIPAEARLSYSQLAALVCTGSTAWNSLYGNVALKPGQTVLFLGKPFFSLFFLSRSV